MNTHDVTVWVARGRNHLTIATVTCTCGEWGRFSAMNPADARADADAAAAAHLEQEQEQEDHETTGQ